MATEYSYVDPCFRDRNGDAKGKTLKSHWIPFTPDDVWGYPSNNQGFIKSAYGGHELMLNSKNGADIEGQWVRDAKRPTDRARQEYCIFGSDVDGSGPSAGQRNGNKLFSHYPIFTADGYFNKDGAHGFSWHVGSSFDGCATDVAGLHLKVAPCAEVPYFNEDNEAKKSKGATNRNHALDWQFNQFYAIYRDTIGNYTSAKLLPRGDNYNNDLSEDNTTLGKYVFRDSMNGTPQPTQKLGEGSHWNRGGYLQGNSLKVLELDLLIDRNTAVPLNSLFVGFEFTVYVGTYSGSARQHSFQIFEVTPIPDAVRKKIQGQVRGVNYFTSYHTIIPELTNKNDFTSSRTTSLKKYANSDYGKAKMYN